MNVTSSSQQDPVLTIPTEHILSDGSRIRQSLGSINGLKSTIVDAGLLQPILVRKIGDMTFSIIDGERRLQAIKELGIPELIVGREIVVDVEETEADVRFKQIMANVQRESLDPIELGKAFVTLKEKYGYQYNEVAEIIGKTKYYVTAKIGLVKRLVPELQERYSRDVRREKFSQNILSDEPGKDPYIMNLNVLEDIARLPAELQPDAYDRITILEMDKSEALRYLRSQKTKARSQELQDIAAPNEHNKESCIADTGNVVSEAPPRSMRSQIRQIKRNFEALSSVFSHDDFIPDEESLRDLEEMLKVLNLLYTNLKARENNFEKATATD